MFRIACFQSKAQGKRKLANENGRCNASINCVGVAQCVYKTEAFTFGEKSEFEK